MFQGISSLGRWLVSSVLCVASCAVTQHDQLVEHFEFSAPSQTGAWPSNAAARVFVSIQDLTGTYRIVDGSASEEDIGLGYGDWNDLQSQIRTQLTSRGYTLAPSSKDASLVLTIVIRGFDAKGSGESRDALSAVLSKAKDEEVSLADPDLDTGDGRRQASNQAFSVLGALRETDTRRTDYAFRAELVAVGPASDGNAKTVARMECTGSAGRRSLSRKHAAAILARKLANAAPTLLPQPF